MIRWKGKPSTQVEAAQKGFDDFDMKLGDMLRGERATLSKSLLDVQRELRIKAVYIAAIENCDPSAFESPSFIAGFVRSYARYLGLDPDWAFDRFCKESGFTPTHGLAAAASGPKAPRRTADLASSLANPNASFIPKQAPIWTKIDPRAVGSLAVVVMVAGGIGYGAWSVLQEVQRVQLTPVEQAPGVVAEIDPLQPVAPVEMASAADVLPADVLPDAATEEAFDRLYRPAALETPVLIARDGPIAAIDPREAGVLPGTAQAMTSAPMVLAEAGPAPAEPGQLPVVHALGAEPAEVEVLAVRPSWVRITASDGSVIFEKVMDAGERFAVPKLEEPPKLRTGESGAIYFAVNGVAHGPVGSKGAVTKNVELSAQSLGTAYAVADMAADGDLAKMVAVADASSVVPGTPEQ
ncbi:helix-turn-helix domain-containing protein [Rhodobacter capsulatus]|uniref:helix-turn-helix domain-containing protein n=1 Tax=Rhodobacter capsulatus TaxID=1061 RepID=UPI0003D2C86D|nr:helix-turn-helix domain-containing protein [Rhodobacter capsulatus]ETD84894.1 4-hydroxy-3-methylbut-2-en-1-yl diphosphate synthase [Rhodobacter capsulatus B6]